MAEADVPGFQFESWIGLLGPAGMPKAEVDRINAAMQKVLAMPAVAQRLNTLGVEYAPKSPADFNKLLAQDWELEGTIVKASGARIE